MENKTPQKKHKHEWRWNYDNFEDAKILIDDTLGIPVICDCYPDCQIEGVQWWKIQKTDIN